MYPAREVWIGVRWGGVIWSQGVGLHPHRGVCITYCSSFNEMYQINGWTCKIRKQLAHLGLGVDLSAVLDEDRGDRYGILLGSEMQWRQSVLGSPVDVSSSLEQQSGHVLVTVLWCEVQSREAVLNTHTRDAQRCGIIYLLVGINCRFWTTSNNRNSFSPFSHNLLLMYCGSH